MFPGIVHAEVKAGFVFVTGWDFRLEHREEPGDGPGRLIDRSKARRGLGGSAVFVMAIGSCHAARLRERGKECQQGSRVFYL